MRKKVQENCTLFLLDVVTFLELIYLTAGVDKLLSTGEERVTFATDFNSELVYVLGCSGRKGLATSATDGYFFILRMYTFSHLYHLCN